MSPPLRSPERDAALLAVLPHVVEDGWSPRALRKALADIGRNPAEAEALFPDGAIDMVEVFCDLTDRWMEDEAHALDLPSMRVSQRVRALVALRLRINRPHKEAVRRTMAVMSLPCNAARAVRIVGRSTDAVWRVAGDQATDFSRYSKRAILAGVYASTLLAWLRDTGEDDADTLAFLDRRLAGVAHLGKVRAQAGQVFTRFRPA